MAKKFKKVILIFLYVCLSLISIILLSLFSINKFILTEKYIEDKITKIANQKFNRKLDIKISNFNIFNGIEINNLTLYNPSNLDNEVFLKSDKLKLKYNLLYLIFFKINITELTIINPQINLKYYPERKLWNFSDLIKSEKKQTEPENKKSFNLNIKVKKSFIKNFNLTLKNEKYINLKGLNLLLSLNLNGLSLNSLNNFFLHFYTSDKNNLIVKSKNLNFNADLPINFKIDIPSIYKGESNFEFKTKKNYIELNNNIIVLPKVEISLNYNISIKKNLLKINRFYFALNENKVLNLSGNILDLKKLSQINLSSKSNELNLEGLQETFSTFLNDSNLKIKGKLNFSPVLLPDKKVIRLALNDFNLTYPKNNLKIENLLLKLNISQIKNKNSNISVNINAKKINFNFIDVKNFSLINNLTFSSQFKLLFANLFINDTIINQGLFNLVLKIEGSSINGNFQLYGLNLFSFNKKLNGNLFIQNNLNGSLNNFYSYLKIFSPDLNLNLQDKYNTTERLNTYINSVINFKPDKIKISKSDLTFGRLLNSQFEAEYIKRNKKFNLQVENLTLSIPEINKIYKLPFENIKGDLNSYANLSMLSNKISGNIVITNNLLKLENIDSGILIDNLSANCHFEKNGNNLNTTLKFFIRDFQNKRVNFLTNKAGMIQKNISYDNIAREIKVLSEITKKEKEILIENFKFEIPDLNCESHIKGLINSDSKNYKIYYEFSLMPDKKITLLNNIGINGSANFSFETFTDKINNLLIKGNLKFDNFYFKLNDFEVNNLNFYFPVSYNITFEKSESELKKVNLKDTSVINYSIYRGYKLPVDNLKIDSIKFKDLCITNLKADISYNNNLLNINKLHCLLEDGSISVNNSFLDFSKTDFNEAEFAFNLEITGVDILKFKEIKVREGEDTKISANARLNGKGFNIKKIGNLYAAFNITHIGNEITIKLLDILDQAKRDKKIAQIRSAVERGALPKLFSLEIKNGELYSKFWYERPPLYKEFLSMAMLKAPTFFLPPSPIELNPMPVELLLKNILKKK